MRATQGVCCMMNAMTPALWRRRTDWVLGADRGMRTRVAFQLMAWAVYLGCDLALLMGMSLGSVNREVGWAFIIATLVTQAAFFVLLRSGWSRKRPDPALMMAQSIWALSFIALGYAVAGPLRNCALMLAVLVITYAMFGLSPRQTVAVGFYAVVSIGCAMAVMTRLSPQLFPVEGELLRFGMVLTTLPMTAWIAHYVAELRERLKREHQELRDALSSAHELATRDMLTGVVNRRNMGELLAMALRREAQHGTAFSLALLDIDGLRQINEAHGETVGDEVLRSFAKAVKRTLRGSDVVARWGGDEFLVMLTETPRDYALVGVHRLRRELESAALVPNMPYLKPSFSVGLVAHRSGDTLNHTLDRADRALAAAKVHGRGGMVLDDGPQGGALSLVSALRQGVAQP